MEEFDLLSQSIAGNGGCDSSYFDHHLHASSSSAAAGEEDQLRKTAAAANLRHRRNSKVNIHVFFKSCDIIT